MMQCQGIPLIDRVKNCVVHGILISLFKGLKDPFMVFQHNILIDGVGNLHGRLEQFHDRIPDTGKKRIFCCGIDIFMKLDI